MQLGAIRDAVGSSLFNAAEALFLAGQWDECEQALGRLRDRRVGGVTELYGLALTALLRASRGRDDAAVAAIATSDNLDVGDAQAVGMLCAAQAQIALNQGDLDAARQVALEGLDTMTGSENAVDVVSIVTLAALALQIEADRAQYARARRDPIGEQEALESARTVAARTLALRARATAAAHRTEVTRAHRALCDAELARAEGRSDPDMWRSAADARAAQGELHQTAYARFREAEAVLASRGNHALAAHALAAAYATARQLGAGPLCREIDALARRARIKLSSEPATSLASPSHGLSPSG
jgi:hypothetical protein